MALGASIADAFVTLRPDFSGFDAAVERGIRDAMGDVERIAESTGESIEGSFREAAVQSDAALESIGEADVWSDLAAEAERTGESIQRSFQEAARQSDAALNGIDSRGGGVFGKLGAGMAALGIGAAAVGITGFGLSVVGELEMAETGFAGLLGSAEEAQAMMERLTTFAATTPLEMPGLANMTKNLLAQGQTFGVTQDNVLDYVTTIGDLTSVLGGGQTEMDAVTRALGQMGGTGRVTAQDMNQIANALPGFSAWDAIAQSMGITQAEARKLAEDGLLPASEAIPALLEGMETFPGAAGAMERASLTLNGVLSTFKDTAQLALAEGLAPLADAFKNTLTSPQILGALEQLASTFGLVATSLFDAIGPVLGQAMTLLGGVLESLIPIIDSIAPLLGPIVGIVGVLANTVGSALAAAFQALAPAIKIVADFLNMMGDRVGELLFGVLDALTPVLTAIGKVLSGVLSRVLPIIVDLFMMMAPVVQQLANALGGVLVVAVTTIGMVFDALMTAIEPIIPILADAFMSVINALLPVLPSISEALAAVGAAFVLIIEALSPLLPPLAELVALIVGELGAELIAMMAENFVLMAEALVEVTVAAMPLIEMLVELLTMLTKVVTWIYERLIPIIVTLIGWWQSLFSAVAGAVAGITAAVSGMVEAIVGFFVKLPGRIASFATGAFDAVKNAMTTAKDWVSDRIDDVVGFFRGLGTRLGNVMGGLADAIKSPFTSAFNAIKTLWNNTVGKISFTIPSWVPGVGGNGFSFPKMADGALVTSPTLAWVGEAGREVVLPLTRPAQMARLLADPQVATPVAAALGAVGGRQAAVHIERAEFNTPVDMDLLFQKAGHYVLAGRL